jgi:hypothetical protein
MQNKRKEKGEHQRAFGWEVLIKDFVFMFIACLLLIINKKKELQKVSIASRTGELEENHNRRGGRRIV